MVSEEQMKRLAIALNDPIQSIRKDAANKLVELEHDGVDIGLNNKIMCLFIFERFNEVLSVGDHGVPILGTMIVDIENYHSDSAVSALVNMGTDNAFLELKKGLKQQTGEGIKLTTKIFIAHALVQKRWNELSLDDKILCASLIGETDLITKIGKAAVPAIIRYLKKDVEENRTAVIRALGKLGDERNIIQLIELMKNIEIIPNEIVLDALVDIVERIGLKRVRNTVEKYVDTVAKGKKTRLWITEIYGKIVERIRRNIKEETCGKLSEGRPKPPGTQSTNHRTLMKRRMNG